LTLVSLIILTVRIIAVLIVWHMMQFSMKMIGRLIDTKV
jgi:hypothetical protein